MSRDEDAEMYGPVEEDEHAVVGESVYAGGREPYGAAPEPYPHFSVLIAADGSAAIDGVSVTAGEGQALDVAILDALQGHARERNTPVTAAISDPGAANVTFVEVAPDGSSRLMEQAPAQAGWYGAGYEAEAEPALAVDDFIDLDEEFPLEGPLHHDAVEDGLPDHGVPYDTDEEEDEGEGEGDAYALPQPAGQSPGPRPPRPLPRRTTTYGPNASRQSDDEFRAPGLLNRPLVVGPVALSVAALVVVPLLILGSGGGAANQASGLKEDGGERPPSSLSAPPGPTLTPTASLSPSLLPPLPSATATLKPTATPKPKGPDPVVGVTATVTKEPAAPETAATAVNRLAVRAPGRHICYRAYLSATGWQKPVCDGKVAGTTGQNRAIKALNIAVSGTGGVAANALVHSASSTDGQGVWMPDWTPNTANGTDLYIGSVMQGAANMLAFAINIGSGGQICQTTSVHKVGWGQTGCANPRPDFASGGTSENDLWLEAVKFTV
ncbi:hypothetical protein AB0N07_44630 [Streptomyces sp. NPDC051172]|uniref:hypothetical protein n=1 Tax=Streptomyces sp. NPDC051172 TaxID=3155796 RepID=UPI003435C4C6